MKSVAPSSLLLGKVGGAIIVIVCAFLMLPGVAAAQNRGSVVCRGNEALVRFLVPDDDLRAPPNFSKAQSDAESALIQTVPIDPSTCKLKDGRTVVFMQTEIGDEKGYGRCGADATQIFSLWVGGAKLYSHEIFMPKCGEPDAIQSIWLHDRELTECRAEGGVNVDVEARTLKCHDESQRLSHPSDDHDPLGTLKLIRSDPHMESFCRGFVAHEKSFVDESLDGWKPYPRGMIEQIVDATELDYRDAQVKLLSLDIQNIGVARRVLYVGIYSHYFEGSFFVVPPNDMTDPDVLALGEQLQSHPDRLSKIGPRFQVFSGAQTAYRDESRYVWLTPINRDGKLWLHASYAVEQFRLPSDIILKPTKSGMREVCAFQWTPLL